MAAVARFSSHGPTATPPSGSSSNSFSTAAELRASARQTTRSIVQGASALTCISQIRKLADDAQMCEDSGDISNAFFKYMQASVILQYVLDSHEYKQETQPGKRGALYQQVLDVQKFVTGQMLPRALRAESKLKELEHSRPNDLNGSPSPTSSDGPNERPGGSIADRLRSLREAGMSVDVPKRISREQKPNPVRVSPSINGIPNEDNSPSPSSSASTTVPSSSNQNHTEPASLTSSSSTPRHIPPFDISTPPLIPSKPAPPPPSPKPNLASFPSISFSQSPPTPTSTSANHQPPSPSAEDFNSLLLPTPSQFSRSFPSLDELDNSFNLPSVPQSPPSPSFLPSVPSAKPGTKPSLPPPPTPPGSDFRGGSPSSFPSLSIEHNQRPSSTPIPALVSQTTPTNGSALTAAISPQQHPPTNATRGHDYTSPLFRSSVSFPAIPPSSPNGNGNGVPPRGPKPVIPVTNSVEPKKLYEWIEAGHRALILDVRTREEFDAARIRIDEIVCVEPTVVTRDGLTAAKLEETMIISPKEELVLFRNRNTFDIVIITDYSSTSFGHPYAPLHALNRIIYEKEFSKTLKRPPMLLLGGLKAWTKDLGDGFVTSSGNGGGKKESPAPSTHSTGASVDQSSEPNKLTTGSTRTSMDSTSRYRSSTSNGVLPYDSNGRRPLPSVEEQPNASSSSPYGPRSPSADPSPSSPSRRPAHTLRAGSMSHLPSYGRERADGMFGGISAPSIPPTITTSIRYPEAAATTTTTTNGLRSLDGLTQVPTPPASSPLTRRRSDYLEQSQHAYSGSIPTRPPIDYPSLSSSSSSTSQQDNVLRPPPLAAAPALERQDVRKHGSSFSLLQPPQRPTIASDYPVTYWGDEEVSITGLKNLGNTCYMNATLQCLSATVPFARFFREGRWKTAINTINPLGTKGHIATAFDHILRQIWHPESSYFSPATFRKSVCIYASQFSGSDQHDSQEFLSFLLDGLHEDLNRVLAKLPPEQDSPEREAALEALPQQIAGAQEWKIYRMRNDSIVVDYFQGQFRNRLQCMTCSKTSTTYNSFMYLSLPIPTGRGVTKVTLSQCLDEFVKEEIMEKSDAWNCPQCKTRRKATKLLSLSRMPPVLLIHLKRFSSKGPFTDKLETLVDFPLKGLDLTNYLPPPLPPGADKSELYGQQVPQMDDPRVQIPPYKYDLYGVTNHFGNLRSGHYTAFIASKGNWLYCDDTRVTSADNREVVGRPAYILFYKRVRA